MKQIVIIKNDLVRYRQAKLTLQQIADIYGCSTFTIGGAIRKYGLQRKKNAPYTFDPIILENLTKGHKSYYQLAKETRSNSASIRTYALSNGVKSVHIHKGKSRYNITVAALKRYIATGYNQREIADEYGCCYQNIEKTLLRHGLHVKTAIERYPTVGEIMEQVPLMSKVELAEHFSVSYTQIVKILNYHSIEVAHKKKLINGDELRKMIDQEMSKRDLAKHFGVSADVVNYSLSVHSFKMKNKRGRPMAQEVK